MKNIAPPRGRLRLRPAQAIILSFLGGIFAGTVLLCLPVSHKNGEWFSFVDALFTATTAFCVTGFAVVPTVAFSLFGQIVILLLVQVGGLGFMTLSGLVFMLIGKRISLKERILMQEAFGKDGSSDTARMLKRIGIMTAVAEGAGFLLLLPSMTARYGAGGIFKALFLSISSFCNAGIDIFGTDGSPYAGLTAFEGSVAVLLPVAFLVIAGGLGLAVYGRGSGKRRHFLASLHVKIVLITTGALLLSGTALYLLFEYNNPATLGGMGFWQKLLNAFFQSAASRSAGFSSFSAGDMTAPSKLLTMLLSFVGASPGGTGGGIKTTTMTAMILIALSGLKKNREVLAGKNTLAVATIMRVVAIFVFMLILIFSMSFLVMLFEADKFGPDSIFGLESILFESTSAASTAGITLGITPYLTSASKIVLAAGMFLGRAGPVTFGLAFITRGREQDLLRYPEGNIMIG